MLFWMRSKTFMSKINSQRGKLTVENRKSREKKRICSEVSVNSPGNLCFLQLIIIIIIIHEYYYGGVVALLLQDHLTMSVSRRCSTNGVSPKYGTSLSNFVSNSRLRKISPSYGNCLLCWVRLTAVAVYVSVNLCHRRAAACRVDLLVVILAKINRVLKFFYW